MTYSELKKELENAPMTWLPGLFHTVVKACVAKKVFEPVSGMSRFCRKIETGEMKEDERAKHQAFVEDYLT